MNRTATLVLAAAALAAAGEWSPAVAQFPGSGPIAPAPAYSRPRVSPYLNLLRGGSSAAGNYVTLVRPELQAQSALNQLRYQATQNAASIQGLQQQQGGVGALATGHPVGFQTQGSYFNSLGGAGGSPGFTIGGFGGAAGGQGFQSGGGRGGAAPAGGSRGRR